MAAASSSRNAMRVHAAKIPCDKTKPIGLGAAQFKALRATSGQETTADPLPALHSFQQPMTAEATE